MIICIKTTKISTVKRVQIMYRLTDYQYSWAVSECVPRAASQPISGVHLQYSRGLSNV